MTSPAIDFTRRASNIRQLIRQYPDGSADSDALDVARSARTYRQRVALLAIYKEAINARQSGY